MRKKSVSKERKTTGLETDTSALLANHPCYSETAHMKFGRVHIPVAPKCNIACRFCERKVAQYYHTSRPGVAYTIVKPEDAVAYVKKAIKEESMIRVAGIAGPGDPLYNEETFEALRLIRREFPRLQLCICTNGLLLPEKLDSLLKAGVSSITVTVNAVDPRIGMKINNRIRLGNKTIKGIEAAKTFSRNQLLGIKKAIESGAVVKVNTVLIPDVNLEHIVEIAKRMRKLKVPLMNIMPLIPAGKLKKSRRPTCEELKEARENAERYVPQFRACRQCRADACGIPGKNRIIP